MHYNGKSSCWDLQAWAVDQFSVTAIVELSKPVIFTSLRGRKIVRARRSKVGIDESSAQF